MNYLALTVSCVALMSALSFPAQAQEAEGDVLLYAEQVQEIEPVMTVPPQDFAEMDTSVMDDAAAMAIEPAAMEASAITAAAGYQEITLEEAIAVGVANHPEYGVVANNRRATDEELRQAKGLFLPSLDFRADGGLEHSDDPATRSRGGDGKEDLWRYDTGLTLTQMLFDGWEARYETDRQKARVLSASNRVREASELIGLSIVESYMEVMRQRELLRIARDNVGDHIAILQQIEDSTMSGRSTQADVEQARARVASARAGEASVRESLRLAEANYIRDVSVAPKDLVMPVVPVQALSENIEEEVKATLIQSPTIDIYEADVKVARAEYEGSKSSFYPALDLELNGRTGHDIGGTHGRDTSASALMVVNWNLYRGGIDSAKTREYMNREAEAKELRAQMARDVENDVRQTWARMISAGERARQFAAQADANAEVVKAYKDQFDLNRRTLLDVLDSQNELFVSRSNMINAEFLEVFAVYRLLALKGELLSTLSVDYPRESDPATM